MSRTVRTTVFAAVLLLIASVVQALPPSSGTGGQPGLLDSVWAWVASWLSPVWDREGCIMDPHGKPCPGAYPAGRSPERTDTFRRGRN
jgi:hypothetical protein